MYLDPFHYHVKWLFNWCEYNRVPVDARHTVHRRRKFTSFDGSVFLRTWNYRSLHYPLDYLSVVLQVKRDAILCYLSVVTQVICCVFRRHCFICSAWNDYSLAQSFGAGVLRPSNSSSRVSRIPHALIGATNLIAARHMVLALKARCHAVEVLFGL